MKKNEINELRSTKMLSCLDDAEWIDFEKHADIFSRYYKKGAIIHLEEDLCKTVDFIVYGKLHVKRHDVEGRTLMVESFEAGDFLGANVLFSSAPYYPMTILAESDARVVSFQKKHIMAWCQNNEKFLERYLLEISDKTKVLIAAIRKLSTGTLREKLMMYFNEIKNDEDMVTLVLTKKELAERYGVARTSLSRELRRMENDGMIEQITMQLIRVIKE